MIIRQSFTNQRPTLYLIATPIGNLNDITLRALEVIKEVDYLYAEDTRVTAKLLQHYNINKELISYHKFNEEEKLLDIKEKLEQGYNIGFCSDAGMPSISDPGYALASSFKADYNVVVIPGASASLTALVGSGLVIEPFTFIGFLEKKKGQKEKQILQYKDYEHALVFYETATRLNDSLDSLYKVLGNRKTVVARELTKIYETYYEFNLGDDVSEITLKGEFVIIVEGSSKIDATDEDILNLLKEYINNNYTKKEAIKQVSEKLNVNKNRVYQLTIDNKL